MKLIKLKTHLKLTSILIFLALFQGCHTEPSCTKEFYEAREGLYTKDYKIIEDYLKNGGSGVASCYTPYAGKLGGLTSLITTSMNFEDLKAIKLIFKYDSIQQEDIGAMNFGDILIIAVENNDIPFAKKILQKYDVEIFKSSECDALKPELIDNIHKLGYNFNYQNSFDGYTYAMLLSLCGSNREEEQLEVINTLKALHKNGADFSLKNTEGKTAKDLAENPAIREYLESVE